MQTALTLRQYSPVDSVGLEVSMADKDAVWSLWQAPIDESQKRPLGFWNMALPSSGETTSPTLRDSSWFALGP